MSDFALAPTVTAPGRDLLLRSQLVAEVTCEAQQQMAVQVGRLISGHLQTVEKHREALVSPYLEAQRAINRLSKDHTGPLEVERDRLNGLVAQFQRVERERVAAERLKAQEEYARLEAQKKEAIKAAGSETTLEGQLSADLKASQLADQAFQVITTPINSVRTEGMRVKEETCFEVTDLAAAVAARPELFKIEPKKSLIKALPVNAVIPGIRLWSETRVHCTQ